MTRNRLVVGAIALTICVPAAAWAGQFQEDSAIDAKVKGLEPVQRQALDIIGVDVTKTRYIAKIIVRFKGDFERHMRDRKFAAAKAQIRLGLGGPGAVAAAKPMTITSLGAGKQMKTAAGRGVTVAVVREGREVTFWVGGIDAYKLDTVEARSFQGPPGRGVADSATMEVTPTPYKLVADCNRIRKIANLLDDQAEAISAKGSKKAIAEARKQRKWLRQLASSTKKYLDATPCKGNESKPKPSG